MSSDISQHASVRMYRRRDRLTVAAALPGAEPEDILVEVTAQGTLTVTGRRRGASLEGDEVVLDEWGPDAYHRELQLPVTVDGELANVTYKNGVLVVVLPIVERSRAARLRMETVAPAYGERVASHGTPVEPVSSKEHHARGGGHGPERAEDA